MSSKESILLVDDEPYVLVSMKRSLEEDGHVVLTAPGAAEGLRLLEENEVALVISDWKMPAMDGVAFLQKVAVRSPDTLTIMLTANAQLEGSIEAINRAGVFKFILKPWKPADLRQTVMRTLAYRKAYLQRDAVKREVKRITTLCESVETSSRRPAVPESYG